MFSMIRLLLVFCYLMLEYAPLTSACLIWLGVAWWRYVHAAVVPFGRMAGDTFYTSSCYAL